MQHRICQIWNHFYFHGFFFGAVTKKRRTDEKVLEVKREQFPAHRNKKKIDPETGDGGNFTQPLLGHTPHHELCTTTDNVRKRRRRRKGVGWLGMQLGGRERVC